MKEDFMQEIETTYSIGEVAEKFGWGTSFHR